MVNRVNGVNMIKKTTVLGLLSASLVLSACSAGHNQAGATVAGAAAGGLLGAAAFHGHNAWLGVLGGAVAGGIVGNQIGKYMDRQDEANMQSALSNTPQGNQASWTNPNSKVTYTVTPVKSYKQQDKYCREYQTTITVGGKNQQAYGRACRQPDGQWKIVK